MQLLSQIWLAVRQQRDQIAGNGRCGRELRGGCDAELRVVDAVAQDELPGNFLVLPCTEAKIPCPCSRRRIADRWRGGALLGGLVAGNIRAGPAKLVPIVGERWFVLSPGANRRMLGSMMAADSCHECWSRNTMA